MSDKRHAQRDAWLVEHPEHNEAYRIACDALTALDRHAAQPDILALMREAGFTSIFVGIETPELDALMHMRK